LKTIKNEQKKKKVGKFKMAILEKEEITYLTNNCDKTQSKEDNQAKFKSLLEPETIELISDLRNYTSSIVCQICSQKIQDLRYINYFHLYTKDGERYITFHFSCAFKPGTADDFNEIAGDFNYIYKIDDE
jgi:hypothetical protein